MFGPVRWWNRLGLVSAGSVSGVFEARWLLEAIFAVLATFALGAIWMRFVPHNGVTGIGAPRAWVIELVALWGGLCATAGTGLGCRRAWPSLLRVPLAAGVVLATAVVVTM